VPLSREETYGQVPRRGQETRAERGALLFPGIEYNGRRRVAMTPTIPARDGEVNVYNLTESPFATPLVYFVNGIRVVGREHALTASYLSVLIERPVWGVFNKTAGVRLGSVADLAQCLLDYTQNATARLGSRSNQNKPAQVSDERIPEFLSRLEKEYVVWNQATLALFKELVRHKGQRQLIIAHSQGNLITSNALFVMEDVFGSASLQNIRVYSLASPSPAWPLGLRITNGGGGRQDNAFMNDLVSLLRPHNLAAKVGVSRFQNAGDFRTHAGSGVVSLAPHATGAIIETLNFLKSIRRDLGLPTELSDEFLRESGRIA
jgi:hypothetical protein